MEAEKLEKSKEIIGKLTYVNDTIDNLLKAINDSKGTYVTIHFANGYKHTVLDSDLGFRIANESLDKYMQQKRLFNIELKYFQS
ncbi:MAG: hypothetical protein ACXVJE_19455 [Mucilaginibacter sp.]